MILITKITLKMPQSSPPKSLLINFKNMVVFLQSTQNQQKPNQNLTNANKLLTKSKQHNLTTKSKGKPNTYQDLKPPTSTQSHSTAGPKNTPSRSGFFELAQALLEEDRSLSHGSNESKKSKNGSQMTELYRIW